MAEMKDNNEGTKWDDPSEADKELAAFVVQHCDRWRDSRDENYLEDWKEYERIFRGVWSA
jgi:glutamate synthase domain-containing protein 3